MDAFYQRLGRRTATIDEALSEASAVSPDAAADGCLVDQRMAAWRQAAAAGDEALFTRRLARDGLSLAIVASRFAGVQRRASVADPSWLQDATWIEAALGAPATTERATAPRYPFEDLFLTLVERSEALAWSDLAASTGEFDRTAGGSLRDALLATLCELCAPPLYERFAKMRNAGFNGPPGMQVGTSRYWEFMAQMRAGGFRSLFDDKPVLLRLIAVQTRQWIETTREFIFRLAADLPAIRRELLDQPAGEKIVSIASGISDPHNEGRSVLIVQFADGAWTVYKPKDLRVDVAWQTLVERLTRAGAPIALKTARTLSRDGYGWTEFIAHAGCADAHGCDAFFRRAGAWLALLHGFAATDMHQENMIAAGEHPVPIDLETILQPSPEEHKIGAPEAAAFDAAMEIIGNSVMTVGLLPAYGRNVDNQVFAMGGMTADWGGRTIIKWTDLNTDAMRPAKSEEAGAGTPNLPHIDGHYAKLTDYVDSFVSGFADYAHFLMRQVRGGSAAALLQGFADLPVRKVVRPTRFYYMLLRRLKNHPNMADGIVWSAQADFMARLADWDKDTDPLWPLLQAERAALLALNVPYFVTPSDGTTIHDLTGISVQTVATPGLERARSRLEALDENEIAWQVEVIRQNINQPSQPARTARNAQTEGALAPDAPEERDCRTEADKIATELGRRAIRRGVGAAWIGLDWLGDSDAFQLVCLGPDLYNGASGIALFLAAHAAVTGDAASAELARAGLAHIRRGLKGRNGPRLARSLSIGAATGLGSIVYALAVMAKCLGDRSLLADAEQAAHLFTDELIAADKQLDVVGGSAGAILGLLRLHRDAQSAFALARAIRCGEHLLARQRVGPSGHRSWHVQGFGASPLNGMSHGAAGFAYSLAALGAASGREEFISAAAECITFEDASYDAERYNWPDMRAAGQWPCQWCHGAPGIGLARLGMVRRIAGNAALASRIDSKRLTADVGNAVEGVKRAWPGQLDTLCCGTLGGVEFLCEAAQAGWPELGELAMQRLAAVLETATAAGDYRWNSGSRQFNLGLFRGLAGVGYTLLRRIDRLLPNVLIWE